MVSAAVRPDPAVERKKKEMDFYFDDLPSTSQSTPKKAQDDTQMESEDAEFNSSKDRSSNMSMCEVPEQSSSLGIEDISRRAQETVEDINHSRTNDQKVMDDFQEKLAEKVTETCRQMKEHMYTVYEENSDEMQVKLQELSKVLESCSKLNRELLEAAQALAFLREGLAMSQRSES
ncbi:uncharacterized protein LOC101157349 isoform X1 [Oryzias latipes]|nr:uncharacterized protein LOC101157349 isoform X1 [Oryzias latipes]